MLLASNSSKFTRVNYVLPMRTGNSKMLVIISTTHSSSFLRTIRNNCSLPSTITEINDNVHYSVRRRRKKVKSRVQSRRSKNMKQRTVNRLNVREIRQSGLTGPAEISERIERPRFISFNRRTHRTSLRPMANSWRSGERDGMHAYHASVAAR